MTHAAIAARLLAALLLLAPAVFACRKEGESPVATPPASPAPGVAATEAPPVASSPATAATLPRPTETAVPTLSGTLRPPAAASPTAAQAVQPRASLPPATATSAPLATAQPAAPSATQPAATATRAKAKITLPSKLGPVTFDHENHAAKLGIACTTCHHPSRREKPLASENQACRDCHTTPPVPPMKTGLQAAFHDPKGATGTCIGCHRQKGGSAPAKCLECHQRK